MSKGKGITRAQFLRLAAAGALAPALGAFTGGAHAAQAPLLKRPIPKSGEMLTAVGLGTAQNFGEASDPAAFAARKGVIAALLEGGGSVIDTSPTYADAEVVVGRALAELGGRGRAFLATKISTAGEQEGKDQAAASFKDLRTSTIDLLQVHNLRDTATQLKTIRALKEQGKVRYVGVTHFRTSAYERLAKVLRSEPLDFVQLNYSIDAREAEREILPLAKDKGVAVLLNLPFGRARLFRKVRGRKLPGWAAEFDAASWAQFFLKYVLANEAVTVALPGTTKAAHMKDNLGAARGRLPNDEQARRMVRLVEAL